MTRRVKKIWLFSDTVVGVYINKMKTTFDFNLDLYQAFKQHETQKHRNKEKLSIKKLLFNNL